MKPKENSVQDAKVERAVCSKKSDPVGVLCFPGTQCDQDVVHALEGLGFCVQKISYKERFSPKDYSAFIVPGGFSYGDYLRAGALSAHSPAIQDLHQFAQQGRPVLGICNGFQILCEAGLLEGTLRVNQSRRFIDEWVALELNHPCPAWGGDKVKKTVHIPIAHKQGAFYCSSDQLKNLEDQGQIWWKYKKNHNGSLAHVAGLMNKAKNVAGLMPHPERAMANWMGSSDGRAFFMC